jgi:AcrR family transcriptional regulator
MIQAAVGVSKATLYRYFATKEALFKAAMEVRSRRFVEKVGQLYAETEDVESFLNQFGVELLNRLLEPESLKVVRLMMMEGQRFPELGRHFYQAGPKSAVDVLENFLTQAHARGRLRIDDSAQASEHFMGMVRGEIWLRALLGAGSLPTAEQLRRHVATTVAAYTRAYALPEASQVITES